MAEEKNAITGMKFVDRSVDVRGAAPPDVVSLESGVACAITFQHDLGVDMSRTLYTGAGKFCMPVTDGQLGHFHQLAKAIATGYVSGASSALSNAAFDYEFSHHGERYAGSYRYDGGEDFDRSLAPFDVLLRDIVKNGSAMASVRPGFRVSSPGSELVVDLLLENVGTAAVVLAGVDGWSDEAGLADADGVVFGLSRKGDPVVVASLHSSNYGGDPSLLEGPIKIAAGESLSLRFTFPFTESLESSFSLEDYLASGSMRMEARFEDGTSGRITTPINPVEMTIPPR